MSDPFERTSCACSSCVSCCKEQPGSLDAEDFPRIAAHLGLSWEETAQLFWSSPGAQVQNTETGLIVRVRTITPRLDHGRCVFLDEQDRCSIHDVAPFGCRMFDTHMGSREAQKRSLWLVRSQMSTDYQDLRKQLPVANSYRPRAY